MRLNAIEPRIYVKGCGFLPLAKDISKNATEVATSMSNEYSQKLLDSAKKCTTDAIKTASKRAIQKTAERTSDLICSKTADKITSISKSPNELHSRELLSEIDQNEIDVPKESSISPEKRRQIIDELRLAK